MDSSKHRLGLPPLSSAKRELIGRWLTAMQSFAGHTLAFVPPSCVTAPGRSDIIKDMSLSDLLGLFLSTFDGDEALQREEACHFRNQMVTRAQKWRASVCNSLAPWSIR